MHVVQTLAPWGRFRSEPDSDAVLHAVVINSRAPRLIASVLVGSTLSVSGGVYQTVFRNPLVSPQILGVLAGSAFGASLSILFSLSGAWTHWFAFAFGLSAAGVGLGVGKMIRGTGLIALVLGGLVANAFFSSLLSLAKYVANPVDQLPAIVYWSLGSLAQAGWADIRHLSLPLLVGTVALCAAGRYIDLLALSDDEARSLGVPVTAIRLSVVGLATLLAALTVSFAGIIGWIGLLVPHIARQIVGPGNRRLLPLSALLGATVLVLADTAARTLLPSEIPLGILTEIFGALAFVLVLRQLRGVSL